MGGLSRAKRGSFGPAETSRQENGSLYLVVALQRASRRTWEAVTHF
jgi:hypothetical protein